MCHAALERVFDLEPNDRTLEQLQNLLRAAWSEKRMTDEYKNLFDVEGSDSRNINGEIEWGQSALRLLENYYELENPQNIPQPNPLQREVWVNANLTVDPAAGVTGYTTGTKPDNRADAEPTFYVRGIVDRLDLVHLPSPSGVDCLRIIDYKSGKAPSFKYSPEVNERISTEAFWQLKVYALLMREMATSGGNSTSNLRYGLDLRMLRLIYLTSDEGSAKYLDLDLGETEDERDEILQRIHADLANVWTRINELVAMQDPKAFVHCDRKFCWCHKVRPRFVPRTLWERGP